MYHRVYFTESLAEKRDTCTSTTVRKNLHLDQEWCLDLYLSLVLCNSPKKYLVLIICLGKKRVYFTQSLEEKRDTCTSTTVRKNLHLDQEWCPDLYWSLVLCNSPKKKTYVNNLSGKDLYHRVYFTESLAEKRDTCTVINNSKEKLTFRSRVVSCFVLVSDSVQLTYKRYLVLIICLGKICIKVYFTQSLEEKRDTCTLTTIKTNLHLDQEWCPDLYWSLILCNSPIKNTWS